MKMLHLLTDGQTDFSTRVTESQSAGSDIKVIDMSKKETAYEDIIDEIFSRDKVISLALSAYASDNMAAKLNSVLLRAPSEGHWQVKAAAVAKWIKEGKNDFLVVDVRPNPGEYLDGHIPGSIYIPYSQMLKPENLKKLPKDKKIILVCVTGQTQNLPVLALRILGYDARRMPYGYTSWIKDYFGGELMQDAIHDAAKSNYPLET